LKCSLAAIFLIFYSLFNFKLYNEITKQNCGGSSSIAVSYICQCANKNSKTENVKKFRQCGMCETKIEKAGNLKNTATVDWDKNKIAVITYDSTKTNQDEILKRIALAGYDSEKNIAPESSYRDWLFANTIETKKQ
jgi:copper chaperone CopZ